MLSGTVSGLHTHPSVSLTLEFTIAGQGTSLTYSGQVVSEDSMRGTVRFPDDPPPPAGTGPAWAGRTSHSEYD